MLQELTIQDLAIIDKLDVNFDDGMTVLTGETGAGKSIIIDAVSLLAGGRGSQEFIRKGAEKLVLQGAFTSGTNQQTEQVLSELGINHDDGNVIIQREINRNGRNLCRVNGALVNTATLKRIGETLVDIHGQNEHQELMRPERHLGMLDEFGSASLVKLRQQYLAEFTQYQKVSAALKRKQANEKEWNQHLDMLKFQEAEISEAKLQPNEEAGLVNERDRLDNFQRINDALQTTFAVLNGGDEVAPLDSIGEAMNDMKEISNLGPEFAEIADDVSSAYYTLQDVTGKVSSQIDLLEFDEDRLDEIEKRLEVIHQLKRKYGDSVDQILKHYAEVVSELHEMETTDATDDELTEQLSQLEKQLLKTGSKLTSAREKTALALEKAVHVQLKELYMEKAVFKVKFLPHPEQPFFADGLDHVEFYIQTNPGETLGPLTKIVSGGELSRMMLALKTIFSESQGITSIIFDEVDTGVSGRVAQAIAEKISAIAKSSQVLCITHLPQVAAVSDHHLLIQKTISQNRTTTSLTKLSEVKRVDELSRMLAGTQVTKLTKEHAQELLKLGQAVKHSS